MTPFPAMIAVQGAGIAGLSGAIAMKRAFPSAEIKIFAESAQRIAEYPGAATPFIRQFHRHIGLDDRIFVKRTAAEVVHRVNWHAEGHEPVDIYPLSVLPYPEGVAIQHLWRWLDRAERPRWTTVARKFQTDFDRTEGHGIRFNANAYLQLLTEMAAHLTIDITADGIADPAAFDLVVEADGQDKAGITYETAVSQVERGGDHVRMAGGEAVWTTAHGTAKFSSVPEARCIDRPWSGNRLTIGQAALCIETFDGQSLCATMADILRAIALMPTGPGSDAEISEYNRRTTSIHHMLADWHAFKWQTQQTDGLDHLLTQFRHRGRIPFRDEDPVSVAEWTNWLLSTGIMADYADASASSLNKQKIFNILGTY